MFLVFDLLAYIFKCLCAYNQYDVVTNYLCLINKDKYKKAFQEIGEFDPFMIYDMDFLNIRNVLTKQDLFSDPLYLLYVLEILDKYLDGIESVYYNKDCGFKTSEFESLNSKYKDIVLVYPEIWRPFKWTNSPELLSGNINAIVNHIFFVDVKMIGSFKIFNHFIDCEYPRDSTFVVAGSPISGNNVTNPSTFIDSDVKKLHFNVDYSNEENRLDFVDKFINIVKYADEKQVSLLCFPELISTDEINEEIEKKLQNYEFSNLKIIAFPTVFKTTNYGKVYYTAMKGELFKQTKTFAYLCKEKVESDLRYSKECLSANYTLHVLYVKGVGRIVFPICKDMLVDDYIKVCRALKVALVVTRSFSPGEKGYLYFSRIIRGYTSFDCSGIWINSCRYNAESEENKIVCLTAHSKNDGDYPKTFHCGKDCSTCLFTLVVNREE